MSRKWSRRRFLPLAGGAAAMGAAGCGRGPRRGTGAEARVAVLKAASYSQDLVDVLVRGAALCGLDVRGKRVLLKPNLVEFDSGAGINTDVALVGAAIEMCRRLGAAEVRIGEGPGHRRDTLFLAEAAGYRGRLEGFDQRFVDLNRDDVSPVAGFADKGRIYLPNSALGADLIISLPKMKTHHWVGATLAMKNLFGLVPGGVYGWPKNLLHYVGIPRSIVELNRIFRRTFAIVDGIVGMEGNGPIQGKPRSCGVVVMGSDLVAVDATCCRIMGIDPEQVEYLNMAAALGQVDAGRIRQMGERPAAVRQDFLLIDEFRHVRLRGIPARI